jgi:cytochrome c-type biogenesis protein CcmH/NrfF
MTIAAASPPSAIFSTLPLLALLLVVIAVFRWNRRSKAVTKRQLDQLEQRAQGHQK